MPSLLASRSTSTSLLNASRPSRHSCVSPDIFAEAGRLYYRKRNFTIDLAVDRSHLTFTLCKLRAILLEHGRDPFSKGFRLRAGWATMQHLFRLLPPFGFIRQTGMVLLPRAARVRGYPLMASPYLSYQAPLDDSEASPTIFPLLQLGLAARYYRFTYVSLTREMIRHCMALERGHRAALHDPVVLVMAGASRTQVLTFPAKWIWRVHYNLPKDEEELRHEREVEERLEAEEHEQEEEEEEEEEEEDSDYLATIAIFPCSLAPPVFERYVREATGRRTDTEFKAVVVAYF